MWTGFELVPSGVAEHGCKVSERERKRQSGVAGNENWRLRAGIEGEIDRECLPTVPAECACRVIISPHPNQKENNN